MDKVEDEKISLFWLESLEGSGMRNEKERKLIREENERATYKRCDSSKKKFIRDVKAAGE